MKGLFICFFFFLTISSYGQQNYKNYRIEWDSIKETNFVVDTLTKKKFEIDYPNSQYPRAHRFYRGLILVRSSDLKGLMDLKGRKLLPPSYFIHFNDKDSIISAYTITGYWIFLSYNGDTLSYGITRSFRYCPGLDTVLNPAHTMTPDRSEYLWGYLDKKANWKIQPKFQAVQYFINGIAKVKLNEKWGTIDENGNFIIPPKYATDDFETK